MDGMDDGEETKEERRRRQNREANARWRAANPEAHRERSARWQAAHPERVREKARKKNARWKAANPEKTREASARWMSANVGRVRENGRRASARLLATPQGGLAHAVRKRIRAALGGALAGRSCRSVELLGCSAEEYRLHLEGLFEPGMTWANWGTHGWHIDHVRPLASFDLSDPAQQRLAFHFSNTRPAWAAENLSKGSLYAGVRCHHSKIGARPQGAPAGRDPRQDASIVQPIGE